MTLLFPLIISVAMTGVAGAVVSICGPLWVRPESDKLAALPAPSVTLAELRLTAVAVRADVFWPVPTV